MTEWTVGANYVYLAGPIDECSIEESTAWRQDAKKLLTSCVCLDPMDRPFTHHQAFVTHQRPLVALDKRDIRLSDFILANVWKKGFGTPMELVYGYEVLDNIIVATVWPEDMGPVNPWVLEHSHVIHATVPDACRWIENVVNRRMS